MIPDSKVHGANMGLAGADRTQAVPHVGYVNPANWDSNDNLAKKRKRKIRIFQVCQDRLNGTR